jgi:DNA-binding NarL/FixJ family response regulator
LTSLARRDILKRSKKLEQQGVPATSFLELNAMKCENNTLFGPRISRLSRRQGEVLHLICKGLRNSEIGAVLGISERSTKAYVSQLLLIFDVSNRTELAGMCSPALTEADQEKASASVGPP